MSMTTQYTHPEPARSAIDAIAGPLLVEFGAPWCGYCQAAQPALAKLLKEHPEIKHIKIHDGRGQPLGRSFRVKLWPNLVFMRDGRVIRQLARPQEAEMAEGLRAISTEVAPPV